MTLNCICWWNLQFWSSVKCEVAPLLLLLPGRLWPGVIVSVRVPAMFQIDLFENYEDEIGILDLLV